MIVNLSLSEIASILGRNISGQNSGQTVHHFSLDSRKTVNPNNCLFICLKGKRHNAHNFINDLYSQGFTMFLVDENLDYSQYPQASFIKVDNCLDSFQQIAKSYKSKFDLPCIGITGSFGKTIIKEWLFQLLKEEHNIVRSPKSYNSQVGLPLSIFQIQAYHDIGIFEAGISERNEMTRLSDILRCEIGIISNIGNAHLENFSSKEEILREKLELFRFSKTIICSSGNQDHFKIIQQFYPDKNILSWGRDPSDNVQIRSTSKEKEGTKISVLYKNEDFTFSIPMIDDYSIENSMHCLVLMLHLEYPLEIIGQRLSQLKPVALRLQMKQGLNDSIIIQDPYINDLESLKISVDFLKQQKGYKNYVLVHDSNEGLDLSSVNGLVDEIISIGKDKRSKIHYETVRDFIEYHNLEDFQESAILIQGDFDHHSEELSQSLQEKAHQTVMEVNITNMIDNLNYFKSLLKPSTKIMAMVKAFSYGSGSDEISSILQYHKVDYLGVAYADEGLALRKAGITLPIMVMNSEPSAFDMMIKHHLTPVIFNFKILQDFITASNKLNKATSIHLELETGMNRLGFDSSDIEKLSSILKANTNISISSVFSHLAASDDHLKRDFSQNQISRFQKVSDKVRASFEYSIDRHILNSNGILAYPDSQMEMVRLGIGLYGISEDENHQKNLKEVSSLKTSISQIKKVKANEPVGYGADNELSSNRKIAILPIGYADGFRRSLSNGKGEVYIKNQVAKVVGKVCMDMTMVDVSDIDCSEGDEVVIFNQHRSIREFAKKMDTIPYEALTSISPRVKRVYFQE